MTTSFKRNISWIFLGNVIHAVLSFLLNIFVARWTGSEVFGTVSYAASLVTFCVSLGTLGFDSVITLRFAESKDKSGEYLGSAFILRLVVALACIVILQAVVRIGSPSEYLLHRVVFMQSLSLLAGSFDLLIYWFRFEYKSNIPAIAKLGAFCVSGILRVIALLAFDDVVLYVLALVSESAFLAIVLLWIYIRNEGHSLSWSTKSALSLLKISYPFIFSALLSTIYGQTDRMMLKAMIDSSAVAYYSVSATVAGAIVIIPTALIEGFRPDIMRFKISDGEMYKRRLSQLYGLVFWVCIIYCCFISLFSNKVIYVLYGEEYMPAASSLGLIVWYTSFSYFGAINNVYFVAEGKTKWVQLLTFFGAVLNVALNWCFIPSFGIVGAAAASLLTQITANFVLVGVLKSTRGAFLLALRGVFLRDLRRGRNAV